MLKKVKSTLGSCRVAGCRNKADYLIGSLQREMREQSKFIHVCTEHDSSIAAENGQIGVEAKQAGLTVMEYVKRQKRGG